MKNNVVKIALLLALFIVSCVILGFLIELRKNNNSPDQETESLKSEMFIQELYTKQNVNEGVVNNGLPIILPKDFLAEADGLNLSNSNPILVYRFSALSCNTCVEFGLNKIKDYFPDYNNNPNLFVIVSGYPSKYQMDLENFLNIGNTSLGLPLEQTNLPFYFILIDGLAHQVFIPDNNLFEYTDVYLQEIKRRYFNKND